MAKLTLYHAAPSRSSIVRWMLEEVGEPYDIHQVSLSKGDNRAPEYLAVNPMGKVPRRSGMAMPSSPKRRQSAPISRMNSRVPSSTSRSGTRAAVSTSSGCSSAQAASSRR